MPLAGAEVDAAAGAVEAGGVEQAGVVQGLAGGGEGELGVDAAAGEAGRVRNEAARRSKSRASAAKWSGRTAPWKRVIGATPLRPASWASNIDATLCPSGVRAPMPVMTTRLRIAGSLVLIRISAPRSPWGQASPPVPAIARSSLFP